jgi:hypothetical protein
MTASQDDYSVGTAALAAVVQADIGADVPKFFQSEIPQGVVTQFNAAGAKAVIDAVDAARAARAAPAP